MVPSAPQRVQQAEAARAYADANQPNHCGAAGCRQQDQPGDVAVHLAPGQQRPEKPADGDGRSSAMLNGLTSQFTPTVKANAFAAVIRWLDHHMGGWLM